MLKLMIIYTGGPVDIVRLVLEPRRCVCRERIHRLLGLQHSFHVETGRKSSLSGAS